MAKTDTRRERKDTTEPAPKAGAGERLTLPAKDGKVDWSQVRDSRHDQLRSALAPLPQWLAPSAPAAAGGGGDASELNRALAGSLYDLLSQLESIVAARAFGCSVDEAFAALRFSDTEKSALEKPTARVLDKYLPSSVMEKYGDEIMLLMLLTTMTKTKVSALQGRVAARRRGAPRGPVPVAIRPQAGGDGSTPPNAGGGGGTSVIPSQEGNL
jgi:hypothetical protein